MYFSNSLIEQMFSAAFQGLSALLRQRGEPFLTTQTTWRAFVKSAIATRVQGEVPSDADSSFHFVRMARQVLGLPESQIMDPSLAVSELASKGNRPVVFFDDFVGSGRQFLGTWRRSFPINSHSQMSFEKLAALMRGAKFYYCPLICTEYGRQRVSQGCPHVTIAPAHLLPDTYGALAPTSILWPPHLRASAQSFVEGASRRAGIPDPQWRGFHGLGLALAFEHSVPDATLPLFYWEDNGWKPLIRRT